MSFFRYAAIIFLSLLLIAGCASHQTYATPETLATSYYNCIENNDTTSLINMLSASTHESKIQSTNNEKLTLLISELHTQFNNKGGIKAIEFTHVQYNDDKTIADLNILLHFNDGSSQTDKIATHKTDSGWKLT